MNRVSTRKINASGEALISHKFLQILVADAKGDNNELKAQAIDWIDTWGAECGFTMVMVAQSLKVRPERLYRMLRSEVSDGVV